MIHIVLYEPEIPANTGNIMRTCMAMNARLHLIEPLGFELSEKTVRRAAMDYLLECDYHRYPNWETFRKQNPNGRFYYLTRYGHRPPTAFNYAIDDQDVYLVFGKESTGIPKEILAEDLEHCIRIPMVKDARSLNLSNCVAICLFLVQAQYDYEGLSLEEMIKGPNFILDYLNQHQG